MYVERKRRRSGLVGVELRVRACVFAFSGVEIAGNLAWGSATVWGGRCGASTSSRPQASLSVTSPQFRLHSFAMWLQRGRDWFFELNKVIERVVIIFS